MTSKFTVSKKWNDERVLNNKAFRKVLTQWDAIEHEGDNNLNKAEMRFIKDLMKCQRDVLCVRAWLQQAFEPKKPEPDANAYKIYLNFFSKLLAKDNAERYMNDERGKVGLGQFLHTPQSWAVSQPIRRLCPNLRFKKGASSAATPVTRALHPSSPTTDEYGETTVTTDNRPSSPTRPYVKSQLAPQVPVRWVEPRSSSAATREESAGISFVKSEAMAEETILSGTLPFKTYEDIWDETPPNLQMDGGPFNASHETDTEAKPDSKWEVAHDIQSLPHIGDGVPDSRDQTLVATTDNQNTRQVDQRPSDEPRRKNKRQKFDHTLGATYSDCEIRSLPSHSSLISDEVPCNSDKDGAGGTSITISSVKGLSKRTKGKTPGQSSQPKRVGPETHPLQDDIPDDVHLAIMKSEGGQQAQDSQPTNEDLELVTGQGSKHQSSMAVLDSEGPRDISSCCTNSVSMGDSEKLQHLTSDIDLAVQSQLKAELSELPPIWAESRQEVCEAFDWFRSYQGGVYHSDNTVKGYLLSAFASKRDVFENDGRLIISHGGGKSESIGSQKGVFVSHQARDQLAGDKSVRALLDNYRSGRPLVLIVDDKYALFPYDLSSKGVTYAVLGFYSIIYAWAEFETVKNDVGRVIRYKFAFRWCEEQGTPWWGFADETTIREFSSDKPKASDIRIVSEDSFSRKSSAQISNLQQTGVCSHCGRLSLQVYSVWICLATNCKMFWKNPGTMEFAPDSLEYHDEFLTLLPRLALSSGLNLMPETTVTRAMNGTSTSYAFTRGIHCPLCGRLSSRYQWEQLECRACKKWIKKADIDIHSAKNFWGDRLPINFDYFQMSAVSDFIPGPIQTFRHESGRGAIQSFTLPYNRGYIHHIRTPSATGIREADKIFERYQEEAKSGNLKFRRWPLKAHKCRGTLLTNYFSHNAGEPYQYVGSDANTVPFEQVPVVVEARQLIQERILQSLGKTLEFNEVLSCAYMERQKMAFHSDAEVGLGPLVAGLSLGSPALMHFRIAARHDPLYERRGILLTVVLRHGDVLVMDGNGVQEYYEHTVVPNNLRIAATARQITPKHLRLESTIILKPGSVKGDGGTSECLHGIVPGLAQG